MTSREKVIKSPDYWMEMIQGGVFRLLSDFMEKNGLNQTQVAARLNFSSSYVSQILNGNFNYTIGKLISLALAVGQVPVLTFKPIEEFLNDEKYPENKYKFSSRANSDGGCYYDMQLYENEVSAISVDEFMIIKKQNFTNYSQDEKVTQ